MERAKQRSRRLPPLMVRSVVEGVVGDTRRCSSITLTPSCCRRRVPVFAPWRLRRSRGKAHALRPSVPAQEGHYDVQTFPPVTLGQHSRSTTQLGA